MKLIMCQGLPGSGKSTWAKSQGAVVRVNKDEIRAMLKADGWVWSQEGEQEVVRLRDETILAAFQAGLTVISDDTNFGRKHKVRLEQLARESNATFEMKRFDVPLEVCLERNTQRAGDARVPEEAIRKMWSQFVCQDPEHFPLSAPSREQDIIPIEPRFDLKKALICDLDGTLSLFKEKGHRGPYNATHCDEDECNQTVRRLLEIYYRFMGREIIYLSGREDCYRAPTNRFLSKFHCPPGTLFMRPTGDTRKDSIVKLELFNANVRDKFDVEFVLDDRNQVVEMWRKLGLVCFQVAEGAF